MLYRVQETISFRNKRIEAGTVSKLKGLAPRNIKALLDRGRIFEVQGPPIDIVPALKPFVEALEEVGVTDLVEFLDVNPKELKAPLDLTEKEAVQLQEDNLHWVLPEKPKPLTFVTIGGDSDELE